MNQTDSTGSCGRKKASNPRHMVLALVFGLLGVLVLVVTANAYVAQHVDDTLAEFDLGTFTFTGLLDIPEEDIDSVQLLPVGLTGAFQTSPQHLPRALVDLAAVATGNVIYVMGGTDGSGTTRAEAYSSIIDDATGAIAPWQARASLPEARAGAAIVARGGAGSTSTIYVVGGFDSSYALTDTIFRAKIDNLTGQMIGGWTTDSIPVPKKLAYASAVEHEGFLYIIGGSGDGESFNTVYVAPLNPDGSIKAAFVESSSLMKTLFYGYAVVYNGVSTDTLYYVGGMYFEPTPSPPFVERYASEEVYFADFMPDGSLRPWKRSEGALPRPLYAHGGALVKDVEIIVTGGIGNPKDPGETFTSTIKAALVDPDNANFRLYNWCEHVPEPCYLGAWQTGGLLPEVRALHGTVAAHGYLYVLGGQDTDQNATNTVFIGSVEGEGALYAPSGLYESNRIDLEQPATLRKLAWQATVDPPGQVTLTMQYRTSPLGGPWSAWSEEVISQDGINEIVEFPPNDNVRFAQYQVSFATVLTHASPLLHEVHLYYEIPDPDLSVAKDTGSVITAELGSTLDYTIRFTNTGGWVAENVLLTETLPENTSYIASPGWHPVSSGVYTYHVGDVGRGAHGSVPFRVRVADVVPEGTRFITNRVEIDYPPMIDAFGDTIVDPQPADNWDEFSNPLSFSALAVTKDAEPPPGSIVTPGSRITYTISYTNVGAVEASELELIDFFDAQGNYTILAPSYIPPTATKYVWALPGLAPRQSREMTVVVRLDDPMPNYWLVSNQASLDSPETNLYHTEVITHMVMNRSDGGPVPMVDLAITDVDWVPSAPFSGTWPVFHANVINQGKADAIKGFWTALYIKPYPSDPPKWPADHDRGYCLNSCATTRYAYLGYIRDLPAGESKLVTFANLDKSASPDFPAGGVYDIYVQTDLAFKGDNLYWGSYAEDNEDNNIWHGSMTISPDEPPPPAGSPKLYLPLISKG